MVLLCSRGDYRASQKGATLSMISSRLRMVLAGLPLDGDEMEVEDLWQPRGGWH